MKTRGPTTASVALVTAAIALAVLASLPSTAVACTGIRLVAGDGAVIYARTMEVGADLQSEMLIVPRGWQYVGETPDGTPGLRWTTRYGFVGPNVHGQPYVCDGLNEKGLAVGNFLFPGTAGYQKIEKPDAGRTMASFQVAVYLLGTCATVNEATAALEGVRVAWVDKEPFGCPLAVALRRPGRRRPRRRDRVRRRPAPRPRKPPGRDHQLTDASTGT